MITDAALIVLFGGSFNPPHVGHMRIAIETAEAVNPCRTLFIPLAVPPHKDGSNLLPFSLRCSMLQAALDDINSQDHFAICEVENERNGPSYTVDTLKILAGRYPDNRLAFLMGSEDYDRLCTWRQWEEFPLYADLIVLPRNQGELDAFCSTTKKLWPCSQQMYESCTATTEEDQKIVYTVSHGGRVSFIPQPRLEISSSLIRDRVLAGRNLDFLVPPGVRLVLEREKKSILSYWAEPVS